MKTAADPFRRLHGTGWKPKPEMLDRIEVPAGPITLEGTRRNCRMVVEYVEGWLGGRGAEGIDSLAGKPGEFALVKRLLAEECEDILKMLKGKDAATETRYRKAVKVALRWVKNYTDLDFRSLGSYTRADLERIAEAPDAF